MASLSFFFFFFNDTATTEIYTLSLHDALPICPVPQMVTADTPPVFASCIRRMSAASTWESSDRKSTRLNSSHLVISYAVFCLKKKKKNRTRQHRITKVKHHQTVGYANLSNTCG